jgi:dUTP pyrophosphatase
LILEYFCFRHCVYKPSRANPSDAGFDLRFNPVDVLVKSEKIEPGESIILSTGLKVGIPHGYMLQVMNRSGNAAKKQLMVGACVVDSGYNGEIFVNLHNIGQEVQHIHAGDKIAQIVAIPVIPIRFIESADDDLYDWYPITISDRGDGKLGSTGE